MGATDTGIESLATRERIAVFTAVALLLVLAWTYTVVMAIDGSQDAHHGRMALADWKPWTATESAFMFLMWIVMMVAMMVPSAAPMLWTFARISRGRGQESSPISAFSAFFIGYLVLWSAFSLFATVAQWALHTAALLSPAMASASPVFSGVLLIAAGIYQFTPIKDACLSKCRTPLGFLLTEWRDGRRGAFVMGLRHGVYCVGCCWLMMTVLFVAGIMNLLWIALLTAAVLAEKALPFGKWVSRALGVTSMLWGTWLLAFV